MQLYAIFAACCAQAELYRLKCSVTSGYDQCHFEVSEIRSSSIVLGTAKILRTATSHFEELDMNPLIALCTDH